MKRLADASQLVIAGPLGQGRHDTEEPLEDLRALHGRP
jgi:hypothetical protein